MCELIYCHTSHDLNLRIKVVQNLKNHIQDDEIVYICQSFLISQESEFNEQWFDVFLYYALIGLANPKTQIRVYSLSILNTIAKFNTESIMDITEKVVLLCNDAFWEIKVQCIIFATTILNSFKNQSHLLGAQKEDVKGIQKALSGKPGSSNGGNLDRNAVKKNLNYAIDIINKCFNVNESKCVQNIGLFQI